MEISIYGIKVGDLILWYWQKADSNIKDGPYLNYIVEISDEGFSGYCKYGGKEKYIDELIDWKYSNIAHYIEASTLILVDNIPEDKASCEYCMKLLENKYPEALI